VGWVGGCVVEWMGGLVSDWMAQLKIIRAHLFAYWTMGWLRLVGSLKL